MKPIPILELLPGDRAVISTKGLCRVVISPSGEIVRELIEIERGLRYVENYNLSAESTRAEAITYPQLLQECSS